METATATATLRLHKVDVHSSTTNKVSSMVPSQDATIQLHNSGSTTTTPVTSPSMDTLYLKSSGEMTLTAAALPTTKKASLATTKVEIENPIFHNTDASSNRSPPLSPCTPSSSPKGKRVKYAQHVYCLDPKAHGRNTLEPPTEKARVRRQASTLSTGSDKVMILGDVAIKEPMIIATKATTCNNTNTTNNNKHQHQHHHKNKTKNQNNSDSSTLQPNSLSKCKPNGTTPNTAIAITTLSPTSCLSRDKSHTTTTVVTQLQKPKVKDKKDSKRKIRFSPFSKKSKSPPLIEATAETAASQQAHHHEPQSPNTSSRSKQFCTPFCSCSSYESFSRNEDQFNREYFTATNTVYDNNCTYTTNTNPTTTTTTSSTSTSTVNYTNNYLRPPPINTLATDNSAATVTISQNWNHIQHNYQDQSDHHDHHDHHVHHQQQVHVCMSFLFPIFFFIILFTVYLFVCPHPVCA